MQFFCRNYSSIHSKKKSEEKRNEDAKKKKKKVVKLRPKPKEKGSEIILKKHKKID